MRTQYWWAPSRARTLIFVLIVLLVSASASAQTQTAPSLAHVRKVYVEKMENNLDQYLTSSISSKFHGSLTVVLDKSQADAILRGENIGAPNTTKATVELVDPSGKVVLWWAPRETAAPSFSI